MISITKNSKQRGDTIVEVLIAVAIVGSVLLGALTISNQSLKQIRQAQERSEAQKIAASSIEKLNQFVIDNPSELTSTTPFCIKPDGTRQTENHPDCSLTSGGVAGGLVYNTSIQRQSLAPIFVVAVNWDGLNGTQENVTMSYHVRVPTP